MDKEIKMYGMRQWDIEDQYMNSLTARLSGLEMVVAGILSDCQEIQNLLMGDKDEMIRQRLNVAKFILFKMMEQRKETV